MALDGGGLSVAKTLLLRKHNSLSFIINYKVFIGYFGAKVRAYCSILKMNNGVIVW